MTKDFDKQMRRILKDNGYKYRCDCGKLIDSNDVSWNNGCTEYGTGYSTIHIICQACDSNILRLDSWYPWIDYLDEVLDVLGSDLKPVGR